jgi:hypothetical protein
MERVRGFIAALLIAAVGCSDSGPAGGTSYRGSYSGQLVENFTANGGTCTITFAVSGTVDLQLVDNGSSVTGTGSVKNTEASPAASGSLCAPQAVGRTLDLGGPISGTSASLQFTGETVVPTPVFSKNTLSFSGSRSGAAVTGTVMISRATGPHPSGMTSTASVSIPVTLAAK